MGDVYAGYDEKLERKVALKVLNADQRLDADARERLLREARALSQLDHPNICRIYDYLESDDVDLLVLEHIDGTTLQRRDRATACSRARSCASPGAIADVLVAAHRAGIVHRDLKPENVMLTDDRRGEGARLRPRALAETRARRGRAVRPHAPVVRDMRGAARSDAPTVAYDTAAPHGTAVGVTIGTPLFMSPEQARGEALTPASDMYSFGLLLQALFTGKEPYPTGLSARGVILRVSRGEDDSGDGRASRRRFLIGRLKQLHPPTARPPSWPWNV